MERTVSSLLFYFTIEVNAIEQQRGAHYTGKHNCALTTPSLSSRGPRRTAGAGTGANLAADAAETHPCFCRCPTYTPASTSAPPNAMKGPNGSPRSGTASATVASGS